MNKNRILFLLGLTFLIGLQGMSQEMSFDWGKQFGSDAYTSDIQAITSDGQNRFFAFTHYKNTFSVEGVDYESNGGNDLLLFALNEDGDVEWVVSEGGVDDEFAQLIKTDDEGNVYIAGKFTGSIVINEVEYISNGLFDMYMAKYSNDGAFIWAKTFGGPNSESIISMEIKYNAIVLGGRFYNYTVIQEDTMFSYDGTDVFVSRFDLEGNLTNQISLGGNSVDKISDMSIDAYANIYITGDFYTDIYLDDDTYFNTGDLLGIYVAKYTAGLDLVWAHQLDGDDLNPDIKLEVSPSGICYISGPFISNIYFGNSHISTQASNVDLYLAVFQEDGTPNWISHYYSSSMESIVDIGIDQEGSVYLLGQYLADIHFDDLILNYSLC